jgi:hypothetical protein
MRKIVFIILMSFSLMSFYTYSTSTINKIEVVSEKFDIKIKNDTDNEVKVINAGSGGSYSLTKGATTTIKMEEGEKLHFYEKGKKGALLLTASKDLHGKVQLLSKL